MQWIPKNVAEAVELAQGLLQSADVSVHTAPLSLGPETSGGGTIELVAMLDKTRSHFAEVESVEAITVLQHKKTYTILTSSRR